MAAIPRVKTLTIANIEQATGLSYVKLKPVLQKQWSDLVEALNVVIQNPTSPDRDIAPVNRLRHFLAQALHESGCFQYLTEIASGAAYEGRKDLGNIHPGDGIKYKGRGLFQNTGLNAYILLQKRHGWDVVNHPELLALPNYSVVAAVDYWEDAKFNRFADLADTASISFIYAKKPLQLSPVERISYGVNGGTNGIDSRKAFYAKLLTVKFITV